MVPGSSGNPRKFRSSSRFHQNSRMVRPGMDVSYGGFHSSSFGGTPKKRWLVKKMENPNLKWMIWGGVAPMTHNTPSFIFGKWLGDEILTTRWINRHTTRPDSPRMWHNLAQRILKMECLEFGDSRFFAVVKSLNDIDWLSAMKSSCMSHIGLVENSDTFPDQCQHLSIYQDQPTYIAHTHT